MRERPNKNWIIDIYQMPGSCDNCKINFAPWQDICCEYDNKISVCFECGKKDDCVWPITGNWHHHVYSIHEEVNSVYNVSDIERFEQFMNITVDR